MSDRAAGFLTGFSVAEERCFENSKKLRKVDKLHVSFVHLACILFLFECNSRCFIYFIRFNLPYFRQYAHVCFLSGDVLPALCVPPGLMEPSPAPRQKPPDIMESLPLRRLPRLRLPPPRPSPGSLRRPSCGNSPSGLRRSSSSPRSRFWGPNSPSAP